MKAILELNNKTHLLTFRLGNIDLPTKIPECITNISLREFDSDGYMEFNTNVGVESMDLLYDIDGLITDKELGIIKNYLTGNRELEIRIIA